MRLWMRLVIRKWLVKILIVNSRPAFKNYVPGIAWFFVVLFLICLPGNTLPKVDDWFHKIYFDKWIHTGMFGLLCILFCFPYRIVDISRSRKVKYFILVAICVSGFGYMTELIQKYWIPGRAYELLDWAADSLGALIGLLFSRFYFTR